MSSDRSSLKLSTVVSSVLLRHFWLLEEVGGRRLVVEVFGLVDDDVGGREALGVDGVVGLEAEEQGLVH